MQAYLEMGKTFTKAGKHGRAVQEFEKAVRIQAASPALWALLAEAQAEQATALGQQAVAYAQICNQSSQARARQTLQAAQMKAAETDRSCDVVLSKPSAASKSDLEKIATACKRLGNDERTKEIEQRIAFRERLSQYEARGAAALPDLKREMQNAGITDWEAAQLCVAIGMLTSDSDPAEAEVAFRKAIEKLGIGHADEVRRRGLRAHLASVLDGVTGRPLG